MRRFSTEPADDWALTLKFFELLIGLYTCIALATTWKVPPAGPPLNTTRSFAIAACEAVIAAIRNASMLARCSTFFIMASTLVVIIRPSLRRKEALLLICIKVQSQRLDC